MSRIKRYGLKKFTLILSLAFIMTLSIIGVSYGTWNDLMNTDFTLATAEFDQQVEVYRIERERTFIFDGSKSVTLNNPITPSADGVITVNIGLGDTPSNWGPAFRNDRYKVYYRVINNSSIPIDYRTIKRNLTSEQQDYVAVSPGNWTGIGAGSDADGNYVYVDIRYRAGIPEVKFAGIVIHPAVPEINPFDFPPRGQGGTFDRTLARVEIKQFNAASGDYGWAKNVDIRIRTNGLYGSDD